MPPDLQDPPQDTASLDSGSFGALDSLAAAEDVVRRLGPLTGLTSWYFLRRYDEDWVVVAVDSSDNALLPGDTVPLSHPLVWASTDRPAEHNPDLVVDLSGLDPAVGVGPSTSGELGTVLRIGLRGPDGRVFAWLTGTRPDAHPDPANLRRMRPLLELMGGVLASLLMVDLDRSRMQRRLDAAESAALSDELTGLGNRRAFERAVEREEARCERFGHRAGVLVIDLDGLKVINDSDGHAAGDELIRTAACALRDSVRAADQVFRVGGDEFAVVLPEVTSSRLGAASERVEAALRNAGVAASIGAAIRGHGDQISDAVARADATMYAQKRRSHR